MIANHTARLVPAARARAFWSVSLPQMQGPGGVFVTKYRIVKPGREGTSWDDFLLALPEKDQLAKFSKEVPLFVRYLHVITQNDGRKEDFKAFVERVKGGLEVESDAFIDKEELLAVMWKNGYTEMERNAIQFTFPSDYRFHYPELAAMFDLPEEDCYKFCMRMRVEKSHIGELDADKVVRKGFIRDHWVIFGVGAFILKTFPFYNYYFILKGFGTAMWFWTNWLLMNRFISRVCSRNEYMALQKTAQEVMEGEDKILTAMKRFAHDTDCVKYLKAFKEETQTKLTSYRQAIIDQHKVNLAERANKQLQSIAQFEAQMSSQLQELMVRETAAAFRDKVGEADIQAAAFNAALDGLAGKPSENDPVTGFFSTSLKELGGVEFMTAKANPAGTIAERVAHAQQMKEKEFQKSFMVTAAEASEVQSLVKKAQTGAGEFDWSKLAKPEQIDRLDALYTAINQKVGFYVPADEMKPLPFVGDAEADRYVASVNKDIESTNVQLRNDRLNAFALAFA